MRKLTVALAALEPEDAGRFEGFARGQAASGLLRAALAKPFRQAIAAAQRVRLQLADDAVRPPRRDLVHRHVRATVGVTVDGIRRHRHTKPKSEIRISKSETNPKFEIRIQIKLHARAYARSSSFGISDVVLCRICFG